MKRHRGNQIVEPGLYFNVSQLSFASVEKKGPLPGGEGDVYRRAPVWALLVVGPLVGLAFVIFLPFIGFAMLGWMLAGKLVAWAADAGLAFARVVRPAWRPAAAFLSRAKLARRSRKRRDPWVEAVIRQLDQEAREEAQSEADSDTLE